MKVELSQADDRLREVQAAMAETQAELQRARQRERLNEDHSARLTATVSVHYYAGSSSSLTSVVDPIL